MVSRRDALGIAAGLTAAAGLGVVGKDNKKYKGKENEAVQKKLKKGDEIQKRLKKK